MNFTVLILGSDANAYYMARCFYELYNKKVDIMARGIDIVTKYSNIINFIKFPEIYDREKFLDKLNAYAKKSIYKKIILIGTSDKYVKLIVENKESLDRAFVFNYPNIDIINNLIIKDNFYKTFSSDLDIPKTFIYSCKEKNKSYLNNKDFKYPIILKPGNAISYNNHYFKGISKVYKIKSFDELLNKIEIIEKSGYENNLIIQEFIPGDDCALYDAVFYSGKDKKVKLMTFAQIGLQERTATGVGNCTVLVNGFDEHGYKKEIIYKMKDFLEKIGYQGFAEFDLKYDFRDGSYKVFEINPRQARSSYYLSACGHNLIRYLVEDLIENKEIKTILVKERVVLSFVPNIVIRKYVSSKILLNEIECLIKDKKIVRPLYYKKDTNFKRKIYLFLRDINYIIKYRNLIW